MARDGNGTYSLPEAAFVYDTVIDETAVNSDFSDISAALTASIAKDGQTVPTANLPMGGYRHTGVGNASARDQYAAMGQLQDGGGIWCGTAGGTANAITLTPTPAISAYATGQRFEFKAGASANTSAVTFAISGLATIAGQVNGAACSGGEIEANKWYRITLSDTSTAQIEKIGAAASGGFLVATNNLSDVANAATARSNLGAGTVTSIIAGTGLTGGTITSTGTIAVDVGLTSGKIPQLDATGLPALNASQLTALNASNLASGTVGTARLGSGSASSSTFLRGDSTWASAGGMTLGTPAASTSGTNIDFSGIPAGAKLIIVSFDGVSTNGTSDFLVQIGSGSVDASGYTAYGWYLASSNVSSSAGFIINSGGSAAFTLTGTLTIQLLNSSSNIWVASHMFIDSGPNAQLGAGRKALSGAIDRLRVTTVSGDTFDAGAINIMYAL